MNPETWHARSFDSASLSIGDSFARDEFKRLFRKGVNGQHFSCDPRSPEAQRRATELWREFKDYMVIRGSGTNALEPHMIHHPHFGVDRALGRIFAFAHGFVVSDQRQRADLERYIPPRRDFRPGRPDRARPRRCMTHASRRHEVAIALALAEAYIEYQKTVGDTRRHLRNLT